eukprot:9120697-Lingulodinium_polyedra.AAC.1
MALEGLTTKPFLAAVWAEICLQATARGLRLSLLWTRRASNEAADAFTNLSFEGFDEGLRIQVPPDVPFILLDELLAAVG